uniref:Uncharacterized protein n=1 Tax=Picea glauca TaxID=3330 RepID=A0A124GN85_PICGL|nr:hypothetical protein ABT39_MTgene4983 [Picea glauca]QHR86588.1 hypothetical protein Q903MT_gene591 [Picea sitchensis]
MLFFSLYHTPRRIAERLLNQSFLAIKPFRQMLSFSLLRVQIWRLAATPSTPHQQAMAPPDLEHILQAPLIEILVSVLEFFKGILYSLGLPVLYLFLS